MLIREKLRAQAPGLAILRGVCLGFLYLGFHSALLLILGFGKLAGPDLSWVAVLSAQVKPFPMQTSLCLAIVATIAIGWCLIAFPAALASRVSPRPLVQAAILSSLWLVTVVSLPGASALPIFPLFLFAGLQGMFFSLMLYHYDFLTVIAAIFTVETWLVVYPLYCVFHIIEFANSTMAMLPWFLMLLLGLTIYFRSLLVAAYQRAVAVFE